MAYKTPSFALVTETEIQPQPETTKGKFRYCVGCKQPVKGHENVTTCHKSQLREKQSLICIKQNETPEFYCRTAL